MKLRILTLTSPRFFPFDILLTEFPLYIQTKGDLSFINGVNSISASYERKFLFEKTDSTFPFCSYPKSAELIAEDN